MTWLRKSNDHDEEPSGEPVKRDPAYVPASMRPRALRDTAPDDDAGDGPDAQVEFLASLVSEIDREERAPAPDAGGPPAGRRIFDPDDDLWAFSETVVTVDQYEGLRKYTSTEIELGELIDDLSITAAALRHRRAA